MSDLADALFLLVQIFFVDLLLGADNAIVIAMACGRLPPEDGRRALILGAAGAIALRIIMLLFANALLGVPLVKLVGAWTLIVIALNVRRRGGPEPTGPGPIGGPSDFLSVAAVIMVADATMSLDNVVALAAIAGGNFWLLALGVLISIPILVYGALLIARILQSAPGLFTLGAALLGWIAGAMAASDPLIAGFLSANAPALAVFAPALGALFVLAAGRGEAAPRPLVARAPSLVPARAGRSWPAVAPAPRPQLPEPAVVVAPSAPKGPPPGFAPEPASDASSAGWTEERLVVAGFVLLAAIAGLIIFIASFYDSLT